MSRFDGCFCACCDAFSGLSVHHILPGRFRRFFLGEGIDPSQIEMLGLGETIILCRPCHDRLEKVIPYKIILMVRGYYELVRALLQGRDDAYLRLVVKRNEWVVFVPALVNNDGRRRRRSIRDIPPDARPRRQHPFSGYGMRFRGQAFG